LKLNLYKTEYYFAREIPTFVGMTDFFEPLAELFIEHEFI
jgi:hypothetical protein